MSGKRESSRLGAMRRYAPFYTAIAAGLSTLAAALLLWPKLAAPMAVNVFFLAYLVLEILKIAKLTPQSLKRNAASADEPAWVIVMVTCGAVGVAVTLLFMLINEPSDPPAFELALSLAAVALGWGTIHTMMTGHYAYLYWRPEGAESGEPHRGLDFPGDADPGGYDFLYFSLVIGMTAQTSDVALTKTAMRKLNLLHAILSFFFNTVLVAAAVNVVVSLGQ